MIRLTNYDSGLPVRIDPDTIESMRELLAAQYSPVGDNPPHEFGQRTTIYTQQSIFVVRELIDEIDGLIRMEADQKEAKKARVEVRNEA